MVHQLGNPISFCLYRGHPIVPLNQGAFFVPLLAHPAVCFYVAYKKPSVSPVQSGCYLRLCQLLY